MQSWSQHTWHCTPRASLHENHHTQKKKSVAVDEAEHKPRIVLTSYPRGARSLVFPKFTEHSNSFSPTHFQSPWHTKELTWTFSFPASRFMLLHWGGSVRYRLPKIWIHQKWLYPQNLQSYWRRWYQLAVSGVNPASPTNKQHSTFLFYSFASLRGQSVTFILSLLQSFFLILITLEGRQRYFL